MSVIDIKVPTMGESVMDAVVGSINKNVGDNVKKDDVIMTLETDKVAVDVVSPKDGKLLKFLVQESSEVKIGSVLCTITDEDNEKNDDTDCIDNRELKIDTEKSFINNSTTDNSSIQLVENKNTTTPSNELSSNVSSNTMLNNKQDNNDVSSDVLLDDKQNNNDDSSNMMLNNKQDNDDISSDVLLDDKQNNVDSSNMMLSDKQDNDDASASSDVLLGDKQNNDDIGKLTTDSKNFNETESIFVRTREEKRIKMTRLRSRIAERLKKSQNEAAILTTFNEIDMSSLVNLKSKYQDSFLSKYKIKLGLTSFFVKAASIALLEVPIVNASINDGYIVHKNYTDIGVAISTNKGLVVPIIHNTDTMDILTIEQSIKKYANKAINGTLVIDDLIGGTFSITNGGVFGSLLSTPIINPPQSAILGLHSIKDRAVVINDEIKIRPIMYVALSYDHRIIDGHEAVVFLRYIKEYIEDCARMLINI